MQSRALKFGWEFLTPLILYAVVNIYESIEGADFEDFVSHHLSRSLRAAFAHEFWLIFITLIVAFLIVDYLLIIARGASGGSPMTTPTWIRWTHIAMEALALAIAVMLAIASNEAITLVRAELNGSQWPEPQTRISLLTALGLFILVYRLLWHRAIVAHWFGVRDTQILVGRLRDKYEDVICESLLMATTQAEITSRDLSSGSRVRDRVLPFDPAREGDNQVIWLGDSGTGKTAQLYRTGLRLAEQALDRWKPQTPSENSGNVGDTSYPTVIYIPFILDLSTWAVHGGDFEEWLISAISSRYDVYQGTVEKLVKEFGGARALPLLDSLDGMYEVKGAECLSAINEYVAKAHRERSIVVPMIICCRAQTYERLITPNTSASEKCGSVPHQPQMPYLSTFKRFEIQPLNTQAIVSSIHVQGPRLEFLEEDVRADPRWQDLLKIPLHLSLLFLTAGQNPLSAEEEEQLRALVDDPRTHPNALRDRLIDAYVERQYPERSRVRNVKKALAWAAHLLVQAAAHPPSSQGANEATSEALNGAAEPASRATICTRVAMALAWVAHRLSDAFARHPSPHDLDDTTSEVIGRTLYLEHLQSDCLPEGDSSQRAYPRIVWLLRNVARLLIALVFGAGMSAAVTLVYYLDHGAVAYALFHQNQTESGVPVVLGAFGLVSGLGVGYSLGAQINATSPIRLVHRVDYDQRHFWILWLIGGGIALILAPIIWLGIGTEAGLTTRTLDAVVLGLDGGAFAAVIMDLLARMSRSRVIEVPRRPHHYHRPGEGVRHSIFAAVRVLILYMVLGVLVGGMAIGLIMGVLAGFGTNSLQKAMILALAGVLSGAVAGALGSTTLIGINKSLDAGGAAALQHNALRMALNRSQVLPRRLPRILEDANSIGLLRRVGGGYEFAATLLRDYFAGQYQSLILDEIERKQQAAGKHKRRSLATRLSSVLNKARSWGRFLRRAPKSASVDQDTVNMPEPDLEPVEAANLSAPPRSD